LFYHTYKVDFINILTFVMISNEWIRFKNKNKIGFFPDHIFLF